MIECNTSKFNQNLYNQLATAIREKDNTSVMELSLDLVNEIQLNGMEALICKNRDYNSYIEQHSISVATISVGIGINMGLGEIVLKALAVAGLLHDLGMTQISPHVSDKVEPLSIEELESIKQHPSITLEMIESVPGIMPMTKTAILHHHENVNGTGYPDGQAAEEIPLLSRILRVADVFDAITTTKPYKKGLSYSDAFSYLEGGKTLLFDEKVVNTFLENNPISEDDVAFEEKAQADDNNAVLDIENKPYKKKKILIVDDVYVSIVHTASTLEDIYDVVSCVGGSKALFTVKKENPDLILMDYEMPDMDGVTTVMKIREAGYTTPVIFLTGKCNRETVIACGKTDAADYVLKPANPIYLRTRVENVLRGNYPHRK